MSAPTPPEWETWHREVERLLAAPPLRRNEISTRGPEDPKFALGDFLKEVPEGHLDALAESLKQDPGQFRSYREVAKALPGPQRVAASWTVHRNLRHRPDLLRDGLTVRQANDLLGGKPIDSKPDIRLSVRERANRVRAALADPDVFEIIDKELNDERVSRKVRSRARRVVSEHAARERELKAELNALQQAKSPYEATVKAELEINRAVQLVHAVGKTLEDLPQSERILGVLKELNLETVAVLASADPNPDAVTPIVVDGETWQDRPPRAALASSNEELLPEEGRTVIDQFDDGPL